MRIYSDPTRESDKYALPDVEVFELTEDDIPGWRESYPDWDIEPGWYWQVCFPGCLPDSDPFGPFKTADDAIADAQNQE